MPDLVPCHYHSLCGQMVEPHPWDGFCTGCAAAIDDENQTRWEQEEWDREDEIRDLKEAGLYEQAVARAKAMAAADPIPFESEPSDRPSE
ncbi:hypothetical protein ACIQU2_27395 [Pseudomonas sp. NPDC098740]|uniref:hypothetical protein n=1 Tax=Pseudomonas sp. NPDC098740 TaxID=3364486 RepID=UPI00383BBFF0